MLRVSVVTILALLLPPPPGGLGADLATFIWQGALPWALPQLPQTSVTLAEPELPEIQHSAAYSTNLSTLNARFASWDSALGSFDTTLATFEATVSAPGSQGNFDPGLEPDGQATTVYDMVDTFGAGIGTLLSYARALRVANLNSSGGFIGLLLLGLAWMVLMHGLKIAIALLSDLLNWLWKLWEAIPFVN